MHPWCSVMTRGSVIAGAVLLSQIGLNGQVAPTITWQNCYGGSADEVGHRLVRTSDHGFVVAGFTTSVDGDVSGQHGDHDTWAFKTDSTGALIWQRTVGGVSWDNAHGLAQALDGGFFLAGMMTPYPILYSQVSAVKLDGLGNVVWSVDLGGSSNETARDVAATSDGGCIVAGSAASNDGDVSGNHGLSDAWVVKLDNAGAMQWQRCFGGSGHDDGWAIINTTDGGYLLAGSTWSLDGDITVNLGSGDVWLVKIDVAGNIQWQKTLGGTWSESPRDLLATSDGGYLFAAETRSSDGDVLGQHGDQDMWIVKLDANGDIQWQNCLGGTGLDIPLDIDQLADGGFILTGNSRSTDGDVSGNHGIMDAWVARLSDQGTLLWQKAMGGTDFDGGDAVEVMSNGRSMIVGHTQSADGDVQNFIGVRDVWMIELGEEDLATGVPSGSDLPDPIAIPNPTNGLVHVTEQIGPLVHYSVFNLLGAVVRSGRLETPDRTIDLSALPPGPYLIDGTTGQGSFQVRVIKE